MKYYLIAGERSGDLHGANLMKGIKNIDSQAEFRYFGGNEMQKNGGHLVKHYSEFSFMGVAEVLANWRTIFKALKLCQKDIAISQPDAIILIDFAGFNLKIAQFVKKNIPKIPIYYYISPKVWAWNTKRVYKIKRLVDKVFCILPFEVDFYKRFNYEDAIYVGNPLLDEIATFKPTPHFRQQNDLDERPIIALLPGSRRQEVAKLLAVMVSIAPAFPSYQFVVAGVNNLPQSAYMPHLTSGVKIVYEQTYQLLHHAEAALVASGTATLETALFKVPQVVCYITSYFTYYFAKMVLKIPYISLVNLVAEAKIAEELIQRQCNTSNLQANLQVILAEKSLQRQEMLRQYEILAQKVGEKGASVRTANYIYQDLVQRKKA